MVFRGRLPNAR